MDLRVVKVLLVAAALIVVCGGCRPGSPQDAGVALTDEEIIEKANRTIETEGFRPDMMSRIYCDLANEEWEETLTQLAQTYPDPDFARRYAELLEGRCYQAVWYVPDMKEVIAGRFCVFVDRYTGEVIGFCGGI